MLSEHSKDYCHEPLLHRDIQQIGYETYEVILNAQTTIIAYYALKIIVIIQYQVRNYSFCYISSFSIAFYIQLSLQGSKLLVIMHQNRYIMHENKAILFVFFTRCINISKHIYLTKILPRNSHQNKCDKFFPEIESRFIRVNKLLLNYAKGN